MYSRRLAARLDVQLGECIKAVAHRLLTREKRPVTMKFGGSQHLTSHPERPRRLAWPRTSPFHGGNTGSNPVGDANKIKTCPSCWARRFPANHVVGSAK